MPGPQIGAMALIEPLRAVIDRVINTPPSATPPSILPTPLTVTPDPLPVTPLSLRSLPPPTPPDKVQVTLLPAHRFKMAPTLCRESPNLLATSY